MTKSKVRFSDFEILKFEKIEKCQKIEKSKNIGIYFLKFEKNLCDFFSFFDFLKSENLKTSKSRF